MTNSHHGVPNTKRSVSLMQKKIFAWAMSMAVAAMITCTGCTQNSSNMPRQISANKKVVFVFFMIPLLLIHIILFFKQFVC